MSHAKKTVAFVLLPALTFSGVALWYRPRGEPSSRYRSAPVQRQDLVETIHATGTVVPEDVVDVGAQVNGQVAAFGTDSDGHPIDFRSSVTQGMVLARIDDALYQADLASAEAQLAEGHAQVQLAEASVVQAQARSEQAERDWERAKQLADSAVLAQQAYDAARSADEQAQAAVAIAQAEVAQGEAAVAGAEAAVVRARRNLAYCTIVSPVDGVILDRRVEIGQTVVASLNAPSLFLLAKDLKRMRVLVQVNEADIGQVETDQSVAFTVDALPGQTFRGTVRKVRLNAALTQNVVTYTVEIAADNSALALLPYLTANVVFEVARQEHALAVPNAALRWSPRELAGEAGAGTSADERHARAAPTVWRLENGEPRPVTVQPGLSDGSFTAVESPELGEGTRVVIGDSTSATGAAPGGPSPFAPQIARGRAGR